MIFSGIGIALSMVLGQGNKLTLDEALLIARKNSFALKNAESTVRLNKNKVSEAQGALGPKLSTSYGYLRYGREISGDIGGNTVVFTPLESSTWTNQLTLALDLAGVSSKAKRGAEAGVESSRNTLSAGENDLRQSVKKAYLQVLRTQSLVGVAQQGNKSIQVQVDVAQKKFDQGAIAKIDLERLKTQKVASDSDVLTALNNHQVAKQLLNLALSRPIETEFEAADVTMPGSAGAKLDDLVNLGQGERPEVKSLLNTVKALDAAKTVAGQGLLPSLNLAMTNQQALNPAGLSPQRETNTTSLNLTVPLFDSGIARAKRAQTQEQINQTLQSVQQVKLGISQEVRTALANMANATARQRSATEQLKLANEVSRIAKVRRDAGEGTVLEIIDAETGVVNAQNTLINAQFDYYAAYADLQRAVGADDIALALRAQAMKGEKKK